MEEILKPVAKISGGMVISKGSLETCDDLEIFGKFNGDIASLAAITISKGGSLIGKLIAKSLEVHGNFEGNALILGTVSLHKGSTVKGTIECAQISIEEGAIIDDATKTLKEKDLLTRARTNKAFSALEQRMHKPAQAAPAPAPIKK